MTAKRSDPSAAVPPVTSTKRAPTLFSVSDGTGETALSIVKAARVQFSDTEIHLERFNKVRTREVLEEILQKAKGAHAIVVTTIVNPELRVFLISRAMQLGIRVVDVLFPLLETLAEEFGQRPTAVPGLLRQLDSDYFKRVWAIEFTVRHDDGMGLGDLDQADVVLVGISRTSKTPLSMYLGHKGYKVANIPLILNSELPEELFKIDQNKVIALTIDPDRLKEIRAARMQTLGALAKGEYADMTKICEEIEWARNLFKRNKRWPVIDVTENALEENAVEVERILLARFPDLAPQGV
jgi:regulator of PEP synthase PpsR (kinase-PPPase family)